MITLEILYKSLPDLIALAALGLSGIAFIFIQLYFSYIKRREQIIPISPGVPIEESLRIAEARRTKIKERVGNVRLVEQPTLLDGVLSDDNHYPNLRENQIKSYDTLMQWYMRRPELLLSERVIDGLLYLDGIYQLDSEAGSFPVVKLDRKRKRRDSTFEYEIIVQCTNPARLANILKPYLPWFGIDISVQTLKTLPTYFGKCEVPGGRLGETGGGVREVNAYLPAFPVTCAHVISPACMSSLVKNDPKLGDLGPDVAVLNCDMACFQLRHRDDHIVAVANYNEVEQWWMSKTAVRKIFPGAQVSRMGEIESRVMLLPIGKTLHRFPHLTVLPKFTLRLFFLTPIFNRAFSREGNSGTWVVEDRENKWIGMIVGGRPFPHYISYLIEA